MMDCLILGDSIAVGTSSILQQCISLAKGGINTWQWNKDYASRPMIEMQEYTNAIFCLGSNDHSGVNTEKELKATRAKVNAKHVYWIMPAIKPDIQRIVLKIAVANNDKIIYIKNLSKDGIHPSQAGYKQIVEDMK